MTVKLLGAACIALAAGGTLRTLFFESRREELLLQQMAAALSTMAREIRWQKRAVPAIFTGLSADTVVGEYFAQLGELLNRKIPLQSAWNEVFSEFPIGKETILSIDMTGDETQLVASLEEAAAQLRCVLSMRRQQRPQQRKLSFAAVLSSAGGLILLLL